MTKPIPSHLKLVSDFPSDASGDVDGAVWLAACETFERSTGWTLQPCQDAAPRTINDLILSAPANPGVGATPGRFRLVESARSVDDSAGDIARSPRIQVVELAQSLVELWLELEQTRSAP